MHSVSGVLLDAEEPADARHPDVFLGLADWVVLPQQTIADGIDLVEELPDDGSTRAEKVRQEPCLVVDEVGLLECVKQRQFGTAWSQCRKHTGRVMFIPVGPL